VAMSTASASIPPLARPARPRPAAQRESPGGLGTWPPAGRHQRLHRLLRHYGRAGSELVTVRKGCHDDSPWRRAVVPAFGCETDSRLAVRLGADTSAGAATWTISGSPSGRPVASRVISYLEHHMRTGRDSVIDRVWRR
jgi:hypothetical protein